MEQRNDTLLQLRAQIDQEVAATDQVESGKGRVSEQVMLGEDQQVADALVDAVGAAVGLGGEEARQPLRRDVGGDAGRVHRGARGGNRVPVDVGSKDLQRPSLLERLHPLLQQDGDRIRFLARRTAGRPDANHAARRMVVEDLRDHLLFERLEGLRIAEETGHPDQQVAKQGVHLGWRLLQIPDVVFDRFDLVQRHAAHDAAVDGVRLVLGKIVPGLRAQQDEDLLQRVLVARCLLGDQRGMLAEGVRDVGDQLRGHRRRRQFPIDQAGGDGAARHAVELGGFRALDHDHAGLALDRPHAERAVAAGSRKDDADRQLMLVLRQRTEEEVDRQPAAARLGRFEQLQRTVQKRHVVIGRDDVGAIDPDRHAVLDLEDLHAGIAPDQFGENALVVRRQMLDQHEGHPRVDVGRHAREKGLERRQTTGRGTDADDRKADLGHLCSARRRHRLRRVILGRSCGVHALSPIHCPRPAYNILRPKGTTGSLPRCAPGNRRY